MKTPVIVAHRGYAEKYPENSMAAFRAAIVCGCQFIEMDVQLTKDLVPVIIHDTSFNRTGSDSKNVLDSDWNEINTCSVGEPERFGEQFIAETLPSLTEIVALLQEFPQVNAFVEVKEESISRFGVNKVLKNILNVLEPVRKQCAIISFDSSILFEIKKHSSYQIGYVLHKFDQAHCDITNQLTPEFVICNYKKFPDSDDALWEGPWEWFIYEVESEEVVSQWNKRGVSYFETMQVEKLLTIISHTK